MQHLRHLKLVIFIENTQTECIFKHYIWLKILMNSPEISSWNATGTCWSRNWGSFSTNYPELYKKHWKETYCGWTQAMKTTKKERYSTWPVSHSGMCRNDTLNFSIASCLNALLSRVICWTMPTRSSHSKAVSVLDFWGGRFYQDGGKLKMVKFDRRLHLDFWHGKILLRLVEVSELAV